MKKQSDNEAIYSSGEKAILEAAEVLFAEKGFDAVSMSAIARLANTSKPNIYHHFENKNELYLAVMKAAVHRSSLLLDALEDAPGSFSQHLSDFSAGQLDNILSHSRSTQLILRETLSGGTQRGQEITKHVVGVVFSRLVDLIHKGQQENEFRNDVDPSLAAFMTIAANMFFFQASPIMQHIPEANLTNDASTYSSGVMDILLNGIVQRGEHK
jgi:TetR/AcrR family transcriptional regulator